jgi:hypothetical protein
MGAVRSGNVLPLNVGAPRNPSPTSALFTMQPLALPLQPRYKSFPENYNQNSVNRGAHSLKVPMNTSYDSPERIATSLWRRYDRQLRRTESPKSVAQKERMQAEIIEDEALKKLVEAGVHEASYVQCVGMARPIHITSIYQPQALERWSGDHYITIPMAEVLDSDHNAIVFALPGHGKSTFLNHLLLSLYDSPGHLPILVLLRETNSLGNLSTFVSQIVPRLSLEPDERIVLLIDGYDEIDPDQRRTLAELLRRFDTKHVGNFILTCRSFYEVGGIHAWHYRLKGFTESDAEQFISNFARELELEIDPKRLVSDLKHRNFDDFFSNPLLLSLTCVLKSGPLATLPDTSIALIERTIDTLTFRWDHFRSINRNSTLGLDGRHHLSCLRRIAFEANSLTPTEREILRAAQLQLKVLHRTTIRPGQLLTELAQWYGLLIPSGNGAWAWAHRTIHDFLAAEFWVQSGGFRVSKIGQWNTRAAYAACLTPDATEFLVAALKSPDRIHVVAECLRNQAPFDTAVVAAALYEHYNLFRTFERVETRDRIRISISRNIVPFASDEFLKAILVSGLQRLNRTEAHDAVAAAAISEYQHRNIGLPAPLANQFRILFGSLDKLVLVDVGGESADLQANPSLSIDEGK